LEVLRNGEPLDAGPHKQRSLLALLLLHPNRVVPTDRILEELWGEEAEGKENALWVYVSRLRAALEPEDGNPRVLVTRDHGYLLQIDPKSIDASLFEQALALGRSRLKDDAETASRIIRDGLELWRGSALQDFAYDSFAQPEINRLEELRLGAVEDAIEADLRCGRAGELIGELETLHEQHPLRERPISQLMLALYRAGRSAGALRTFERYRRGLGEELGIDPSPELCRLEEQILLHDSRLQLRRPRPVRTTVVGTPVNPFRGLRPFSEDDAAEFFGRDRLIADVVRRLSDGDRLIALIGPSGSGKSSAVRAGLIPSLRKGAVPGSDQWLIAHMLPGADPFIELEAALLRSTIDAPDSLAEALRADDDSGLLRATLRVLPSESSRMVLVIDQFEELFTLVADETVRTRFLDQLVGAVNEAYGRVVVMLTLRADFYGRPLEHADFGTLMGSGVVNVVPLTSDELEAAALEPARHSGVAFEPALLAELITDVIGQPGALPMFQYTLTELYDRREGNTLTFDTYRSMGGVRGALTRGAEDLHDRLDESEREVARQLFLRLVTIAEHDEWSRRRVHASELVALDVDVVSMQTVIEEFARHRLLSLDRDQVSGAPTVEVAHEALLHEWDRLRGWIEQNREDLLRHRELAGAAARWHTADRDQDYLYVGGRLEEALRWSEKSAITPTAREREFLESGAERRRVEEEMNRERLRQQQRLERSSRWRTRGMVAAVALLVAVIGVVLWATRSQGPKIAFVYEGSGSAQALTLDGWEQALRELDFQDAAVIPLIDPEEDMRDLAEAGYEMIIDGLFDLGEYAYRVADDYPDTSFVVFDGEDKSRANVTVLEFEREGGAYLMGVAAALQSKTGMIGFIGAWQSRTSEARRAAFTAGARSVDPDIAVDAAYLGPFHDGRHAFLDIELARETASNMYRSGADVIHHSAGEAAEGIVAAAAELLDEFGELWVIGSEIDEARVASPEHQDRFLTSLWKRRDLAVYEAIRAYLAGELETGHHELGLDSGSVDYSREGALSESHAAALEQKKNEIIAGLIVPPSTPSAPPRWTRTPAVFATLTFDGVSCSSAGGSADVMAGDVLRVDVINNSDVEVGVTFSKLSEDIESVNSRIFVKTFAAAGHQSAVAMRVESGTFTAYCFDADQVYEGVTFVSQFETSCEGPAPTSDDPEDVVQALGEAINMRDADAVCSLFAEDATVPGEVVAELLTPTDDNRWFLSSVFTAIEASDGGATWSSQTTTAIGDLTCRYRAGIENGRILWIEPPDCG
jgi:basic membrane lipoprotein Med (substrate-binding protein (PBP1-ABC) superfamily)/DNA-binding SARP family transcriptional activator